MNVKQTALFWLEQGIATIPISYRSKQPNFRVLTLTDDINGDGRPSWERMKTKLPTEQNIQQWYTGKSNIAVVCGWQNLVIVDFDNLTVHDTWLHVQGQNGYADTHTVSTGRGYHYYYYAEKMPEFTYKFTGGEIKSSGYCLTYPSIHPSGRRYTPACHDMSIMDIGTVYDVVPEEWIIMHKEHLPCRVGGGDLWQFYENSGNYSEINQSVRILSFFDNAKRTGDDWYTVYCPFHDDGRNHHRASGWINNSRNRFGCHRCITGSISVIDFCMRLDNIDAPEAARQLRQLV